MSKFVKLLFASALMFNISTTNAAFVQTVTNGGDGFVDDSNGFIVITGSNNGAFPDIIFPSLTSYTDTISVSGTYQFVWQYTTDDTFGIFDPAGYSINGNLFQLSSDSLSQGEFQNGSASVSLMAGDIFGWYVNSIDSTTGPARLTIIEPFFTPAPAAVPVPAAAWLFGSALLGLVGWRKRQAV